MLVASYLPVWKLDGSAGGQSVPIATKIMSKGVERRFGSADEAGWTIRDLRIASGGIGMSLRRQDRHQDRHPDRRYDRRQAGNATAPLVVLLLVLVVAGGWNYHRNWQAEKATESSRPYRAYAEVDLESLRDAYASELAGVKAKFDSAKRGRARPAGDVGSIAGNVEQFQKATRASTAIRRAAADVVQQESQIAALDRELEIRSRFGQGIARHMKRLTTI